MAKKQKSGLYRSKVKIGMDAAGKEVFKYISGHTKKELEQHRQEVINYYIKGESVAEDRLFGEYAQEWYRVRKEPFIRPGTQATYRSMLNKHILPKFGNRKLRAIRALELQEFLQQFADSSRSHITIVRVILGGIFQSACQDNILKENPAKFLVNPGSTKAAEKLALTDTDRAALERVCVTDPRGDFIAVLYYLGLRIGEAAALKWCDFDWKTRTVHIQRKLDYHDSASIGDPKTDKSNRVIPVPEPLAAILFPKRQLPDVFLFQNRKGAPLKRDAADTLWRKLMTAAGLVDDDGHPKFTPHALRHNYVTMCYESGIDPYTTMRLAGHTNITTTMNIYTHMSEQQIEKARSDVDEMFKNKSCTKVATEPKNR